MLTVHGPEGLEALVGQHIGWSEPIEVTQQQVDTFADATGEAKARSFEVFGYAFLAHRTAGIRSH